MPPRFRIFFKLSLACLFLVWSLVACSRPEGEEAALQARLEGLAMTVEERDASDLTDFLAEDFSGPSGMTRELAQAYARTMMGRYSELGVTWTVNSLEIQGDRARTQLNVVLTGKAMVPGFEGRGRLMIVDLGWRRDGNEWYLVNAQWRGALERSAQR